MAFALSRSYVAACGLWGMGVWEWRVEGVAGLFGLSNGRRGTAEGKFAPGHLFPLCAVRWYGCVPVCAYMHKQKQKKKNAHAKKARFFLPASGLVLAQFFSF